MTRGGLPASAVTAQQQQCCAPAKPIWGNRMSCHRLPPICMLHLTVIVLALCMGAPVKPHAQEPSHEVLIETKLVASDGLESDSFGSAIAVSGDILVSAAPGAVNAGRGSRGAVYVFMRDLASGAWLEHKKLLPSADALGEGFGTTIAISGNTLVVGAPSAGGRGAVFIFERHQGGTDNWGEVVARTESSVDVLGKFGSSVAIEGDLLAIGARTSTSFAKRGRVTLFERNRGGANAWGQITTIDDTAVGDPGSVWNFASGVALYGDLLLVGANSTDVSYVSEHDGAAYLFRRNAANPDHWDFVSRLIAPGADRCVQGLLVGQTASQSAEFKAEAQRCAREESSTDWDNFGTTVALDGDTIAISAPSAENEDGRASAGAVYLYERDPGGTDLWISVAKLRPSDAAGGDFGGALALAGPTLLVGADLVDGASRSDQGAAYVFARDTGGSGAWSEVDRLIAGDALSRDRFGAAVALDGQAQLIGAKGEHASRGAVYNRRATEEPPPPPITCQPAFPSTGELHNASVIAGPSGALLGAVDGTLAAPLSVWLREVPAPLEPLFDGAAPRGIYYNAGADCTTFAPAEAPFALALPVPETTDTSRLGVAVLTSASHLLDGPEAGAFWAPVSGLYDPDRRLYLITLAALVADGSTFVLIEHPNLGPATVTRRAELERADDETPPAFVVRCFASNTTTGGCVLDEETVRNELLDAYVIYQRQKFLPPALDNKQVDLNDDGVFKITEDLLVYKGIFIRSTADPECQKEGEDVAGFYNPTIANLTICVPNSGMTNDVLHAVVRHELFHAIQYAYPNVKPSPDPTVPKSTDDWVLEGTAEAAIASDTEMHRSDHVWPRQLRRVDVKLAHERGKSGTPEALYPYQTQDFWVHLFRADWANNRNFNLGELASFFERGATTASVADWLGNRPSVIFAALGQEYWAWVKNQIMEKQETFDGKLTSPCQLQQDLISLPAFSYPAVQHVFGFFESLQSTGVRIDISQDVRFITVTAERSGEVSDLAFKVYVEGAQDCVAIPEGARLFSSLPKGSILYVILANTQHLNPASVLPPFFKVEVLQGG
jgi:hypothetical protein